jgi:hypothetical protein
VCKVYGRRPGQVAAAFYRVSERLGICTEPLPPTETPRVGQIDVPFIARWSRRCARCMASDLARSPRHYTECQRDSVFLPSRCRLPRRLACVPNRFTFYCQVPTLLLQGGQKCVQGGWLVTWPGRRGFVPSVRETRYFYRAVAAYRDALRVCQLDSPCIARW